MIGDPPDLPDDFFNAWLSMCATLGVDPIDIARVCYSESGMRASAHNLNGHASGVFQAMPATLTGLGWSQGHEAFRELTATEQVPFLERYLRPYASWCHSDALCYVAIFLPSLGPTASKSGLGFVLTGHEGPLKWAYLPNRALDRDNDGAITVGDLAAQLTHQCVGARWDAILWRLREAMGMQPSSIPPPPDTQPEGVSSTASEPTCFPAPIVDPDDED